MELAISESEIKKTINLIKQELQALSAGSDLQKNTSRIIEWYSQAPHRIIKLMCFPLIKSLQNVDYTQIFSVISQDLISPDDEIQLNALKLLYQMPPSQALEILRNNEKDFLKILKNSEFHYERLVCLHDFLMKAYLKNFAQDPRDDCREQIHDLYLKIADSIFQQNRDITRDSIEIFLSLYREYLDSCTDFNAIDLYFDGNGPVNFLLNPLIMKLTNFFVPKIEILLSKILSYELRIRSHLVTFVVLQLEVAFKFYKDCYTYGKNSIQSFFVKEQYLFKCKVPGGGGGGGNNQNQQQGSNSNNSISGGNSVNNSIVNSQNINNSVSTNVTGQTSVNNQSDQVLNLQEFYEKLLFNCLIKTILKSTYEFDILQDTYLNIFRLLNLTDTYPSLLYQYQRNEILWEIFEYFLTLIKNQNYRKELNIILINIATQAMKVNCTYMIGISMKILEIVSQSITHQFSRFQLMIICCYNLIEASLHLLTLGKNSCIFSLFNQPWFIQVIKPDEEELGSPTASNQSPSNMQISQSTNTNTLILIKEELVISLIVAAIYGKIRQGNKKEYCQIILEVLDVTYRIINWKYMPKSSLHDIYNKTVTFAIDFYLILLEDTIQFIESQQLNIRLVEIIKRINQNEINFIPKLKAISVICKNFESSSLEQQPLEYPSILSDFRMFLIQPQAQSIFFEKYLKAIQSQSDLIKYLYNLELVFQCLYHLTTKYDSPENELKVHVISLIGDYKDYLSQLSKTKGAFAPMLQVVNELVTNFEQSIQKEELVDPSLLTINKEFLSLMDIEPGHRQQMSQEPHDLLTIAFNIFSQGICKKQMLFHTDIIESDNIIKNLKQIYISLQPPKQMNHHYLLHENPVLITGISDFVQIYASHALFIYKSLVSINLKVINMASFKLDNIKLKIIYTYGVDIFPQNTNPSQIVIEELNPYNEKSITFCLNVEVVELLYISFKILIEDGQEPITLRTQPYKIGLLNFIIPNYINMLSKHIFQYIWSDMNYSCLVKCQTQAHFHILWHTLKSKPFSCIILEGFNFQESKLNLSYHSQKQEEDVINSSNISNERDSINQLGSLCKEKLMTIGMLGGTWDGIQIGINIQGISSIHNNSMVNIDIKTTKSYLLEQIKQDIDNFISELSDGLIMHIQTNQIKNY